jgi:hypothetical protein
MWQAGRKARKRAPRATDKKSSAQGKQEKNALESNERRTNIYENKGPLWKTSAPSANVYGNKGGWPLNPGMLLKTKGVNRRWGG